MLVVAVVILYILHFTSPGIPATPQPVAATDTLPANINVPEEPVAPTLLNMPQASRIVYVHVDSLLDNYNYYQNTQKKLEQRTRAAEKDIEGRMRTLEKDMMEAQQKAQAGQMTRDQMMQTEQELMQRQQELVAYRDKSTQALVDEEKKMTKELYGNIRSYLTKYKEQNPYDYVLIYTDQAGAILYANDSLNITADVLKGLNTN